MKLLLCVALVCGICGASVGRMAAQTDQDLIEVARSVVKVDRQTAIVAAMNLTEDESKAFWPLYHHYRTEMDKVGDDLMKLVLDYAKFYPAIPDKHARQMLQTYTDLQRRQVETRARYLHKFGKILPPDKALRFAQIETRLDLLVHLQLAAAVPLAPTGIQNGESKAN
jgi:hypothetical protein